MRTLLILSWMSLLGPSATAHAQAVSPVVKEGSPGLFRSAKLTPDSAVAMVQRLVPNGRLLFGELEREEGRLVYSFDLKDGTRPGVREIWLDASTGRVVSDRRETAAEEAAERAHDVAKRAPHTSSVKPHTP